MHWYWFPELRPKRTRTYLCAILHYAQKSSFLWLHTKTRPAFLPKTIIPKTSTEKTIIPKTITEKTIIPKTITEKTIIGQRRLGRWQSEMFGRCWKGCNSESKKMALNTKAFRMFIAKLHFKEKDTELWWWWKANFNDATSKIEMRR